ncbi:VOC family protein [Streptomyces sp. NBC_01477]|uniref:VOC family protein n=1 Tax=Streptomyces sp. NBC_01477 TaxID=2976015 RepID=UPI002E31B4C8|nr:VOC family protein [Streptomyces sp. NBC_01477]
MSAFGEGAPCWVDASLPDLAAGRRFYGELFGWTFEDQGEDFGHYTLAFRDEKRAAALMGKPDPAMPTSWSVYFASADATGAADRIGAAGGQVVFGPDKAGEAGVMVGAIDPGGSFFGIWQADGHLGFEITEQPGAFCWTENHTQDTAAVDPFYASVFGYRAEQIGDGEHFDYKVWSLAAEPEQQVGGRLKLGAGLHDEQPSTFRVYFAVDDCDAAAARVRELGGQVTGEPADSPFGRAASVTDDQGAGFTVIDTRRKGGSIDGS